MKSQSDLVQFLIQKLSLRSYQEINQRQGRVASYIQMKSPVLRSWRGARTRAGMYVLYLHEKWFSSLPVYNGLMTKNHSEKLEVLRITWQILCPGKQTMISKTKWGARAFPLTEDLSGTVESGQCWAHTRSRCRVEQELPPVRPALLSCPVK